MIPDDDHYTSALYARQNIPAGLLWAMLKSQFYLAVGFVGATVAAVALRQLVMAQHSRLTPLELMLAAVAGIVMTAFAWRRASAVLAAVADDPRSPEGKGVVQPPVWRCWAAIRAAKPAIRSDQPFQHLHVHQRAGVDIAHLGGKHHEAVGA